MVNRVLLIACLMLGSVNAFSQMYVRYEMNDDSFHGFYSDQVDSIGHAIMDGERVQVVHQKNSRRVIPLNSIRSVSFESVSLDDASAVGEYRMYELDMPEEKFKKIYVDNRAVLLASKNGDFGANDTILFSSDYNGVKALMYTDSLERVRKFFDGDHLFVYDYNEDGSVDVINLNGEDVVSRASHSVIQTKAIVTKSFKGLDKLKVLRDTHLDLYKNDKVYQEYVDFELDRIIELSAQMAQIKANIENDPELHKERLLYNSLSVLGDLVGIGYSLSATIATGGLTAPLLAGEIGLLYFDLVGLLDEIHPSWEQQKKYAEFYAQKYGISVLTLPVNRDELKPTIAYLNGVASIPGKLKGRLYFKVWEWATDDNKFFEAQVKTITSHQYDVSGTASGLKSNTNYNYLLALDIEVDGLLLTYQGDIHDFSTPKFNKGSLSIESITNVTSTTATVKIKYTDMDPSVQCGLDYYSTTAQLSQDGWDYESFNFSGSGTKSVTLTKLYPDADYKCRVVISDLSLEWPLRTLYEGDYETFHTELYGSFPSLAGTKVEDHSYPYYPKWHSDVYITELSDNSGSWGECMIAIEGPIIWDNIYTVSYETSCGCHVSVGFYVDPIEFTGFVANTLEHDPWFDPWLPWAPGL